VGGKSLHNFKIKIIATGFGVNIVNIPKSDHVCLKKNLAKICSFYIKQFMPILPKMGINIFCRLLPNSLLLFFNV
jgi:hypothetical protein